MTSGEIKTEVDAFFASYIAAFERFDAAGLAAHFTYPCQIAGAGDPVSLAAIASAREYVAIITRFLSLYRKAGVASGRILTLSLSTLSNRLAWAQANWQVCNQTGGALYEFTANYTFVKLDNDWRIAAIAHNELPCLQQVLKRSA